MSNVGVTRTALLNCFIWGISAWSGSVAWLILAARAPPWDWRRGAEHWRRPYWNRFRRRYTCPQRNIRHKSTVEERSVNGVYIIKLIMYFTKTFGRLW